MRPATTITLSSRQFSGEEVLMRDDIDAATRSFDAVESEPVHVEEDAGSESAGAPTLDFSRYRARRIRWQLLGLLEALRDAIERRDLGAVWAAIDEADSCRSFPLAVREEALTIAQMSPTVHRAPLRLFRYHYLLSQLGDEPLEVALTPSQLALDVAPAPSGATPVRELPFPGPHTPDHDPHRGGSDRRRSGSR
jgi:hypothetical protein